MSTYITKVTKEGMGKPGRRTEGDQTCRGIDGKIEGAADKRMDRKKKLR
jgi:hypothetical protein